MKSLIKKKFFSVVQKTIYWVSKNIGSIWFYGVHKTNTVQNDVDIIIVPLLKKSQMFITKTRGAASELVIPGDWTHALIYIGLEPRLINGAYQMVHIVHEATTKEGYVEHYLSDVITHTDNWALLELNDMTPYEADLIVEKSKKLLGRPYDFCMEIDDDLEDDDAEKEIFCSEGVYKSVNFARPGTLDLRETWGYPTFTPQDCYNAQKKFKLLAQKVDGVVSVF